MSKIAAAKERVGVHEIGAKLFPDWKPGRKCRCPWRDDRNASFSVSEDGRLWNDFAEGGGGDAVAFVARALNLTTSDAGREFLRMAGDHSTSIVIPGPRREESPPWAPEIPPEGVTASWRDGVSHLCENPDAMANLARWRGWPVEVVRQLGEAGKLGLPRVRGARAVGWIVEAPSGLPVGFHARLKPRPGDRASWLFLPNRSEHGQGIPALPFVLGKLHEAELVVLTEGQWDAVSFAIAAGWFPSWPSGRAVVGVRGAQGVSPLLRHFRGCWPSNATAVLIPDNDAAGKTWTTARDEKPSFAERLSEWGSRVLVTAPPMGVKDLNDALRDHPEQTSTEVRDFLSTLNLS